MPFDPMDDGEPKDVDVTTLPVLNGMQYLNLQNGIINAAIMTSEDIAEEAPTTSQVMGTTANWLSSLGYASKAAMN